MAMLNEAKMSSLKDKIKGQAEVAGAVAELVEEEVKPKAKVLKGLKVGKNKKNKNKNDD